MPQGAPTFTRKPQILQKTSDSGDPAIVFDIGFQADQNPEVIWLNSKGKKMKESSRIKFGNTPDGGANTYTAQLELKVSLKKLIFIFRITKPKIVALTHATLKMMLEKLTLN